MADPTTRPILGPGTQTAIHPPGGAPLPGASGARAAQSNDEQMLYASMGDESVKGVQWEDPTTGGVYLINPVTGETIRELSGPIPGWVPGRGVPAQAVAATRAPRYPEEIEQAQLTNARLRQELLDPLTRMQRDQAAAIQAVREQLATGQIDPAEADRIMTLSRANMEAALQGTTSWAMEQDRRAREAQDRQDRLALAGNVMDTRTRTGSSLAQSLFQGAGGVYGNILGSAGAPTNFNPLLMASDFADQLSGGPQLNEMARALLMGALGQRG